jgi:cell division protease FtsH
MGGRVAEEIVFGKITTGAQNDLEKITALCYAMVVDYGMSESIGYISFNLSGKTDQPRFDKPFSDETARLIDLEVKAIIADVREQTRALLTERRDKLEALAQALLVKEVLNENDLREVLGERPYPTREHATGVSAEGEPVNHAASVASAETPPAETDEPLTVPGGDGAPADTEPAT